MKRVEIHVQTLVLDGLRPDEAGTLLRAIELALGELLAGRAPAADPGGPAGAVAAALAGPIRDALREPW